MTVEPGHYEPAEDELIRVDDASRSGYIATPDSDTVAGYTLRDVDVDSAWYHGTSADFNKFRGSDAMLGGTSFVRDYNVADVYSSIDGGAFKRNIKITPNRGHVIAARLNFPPNTGPIPHVKLDQNKLRDISSEDFSSGGDTLAVIKRIHASADQIAEEGGHPAYVIVRPSSSDELVVRSPGDHVNIVERDVQGEVSLLPPSLREMGPAPRFGLTDDDITMRPLPESDRMASVSEAVDEYKLSVAPDADPRLDHQSLEYQGMSKASSYAPKRGRGQVGR